MLLSHREDKARKATETPHGSNCPTLPLVHAATDAYPYHIFLPRCASLFSIATPKDNNRLDGSSPSSSIRYAYFLLTLGSKDARQKVGGYLLFVLTKSQRCIFRNAATTFLLLFRTVSPQVLQV